MLMKMANCSRLQPNTNLHFVMGNQNLYSQSCLMEMLSNDNYSFVNKIIKVLQSNMLGLCQANKNCDKIWLAHKVLLEPRAEDKFDYMLYLSNFVSIGSLISYSSKSAWFLSLKQNVLFVTSQLQRSTICIVTKVDAA